MSRIPAASHDPDIVASAQALRRAARRALALGLSTGTPVYVLKDGKIEDLTQTVSAYKTGASDFVWVFSIDRNDNGMRKPLNTRGFE